MTQPDWTTDRPPMPPAEFLKAVTMVGERAAAGYGWQEGYLAGRAAAAADIRDAVRAYDPASPIADVARQCANLAGHGTVNDREQP